MDNFISIYIHIPVCFSKCSYCDFFSVPCFSVSEEYLMALENELKYRMDLFKKRYNSFFIKSVYVGGGTPSLLSENQFKQLKKILANYIPDFSKIEFTVEVNPDDVCKELLDTLNEIGVNRISCGIQSMNEKSLKYVNRRADAVQNLNALEQFKKFWKKKISVDLIAGLPYEDKETFIEGIKKVIEFKPEHISLYTLTIEEGTVLYNQIEENKIEYDFDFSDELWITGRDILIKNDYKHYEVSNFSKDGFECIHNLTYWNHQNYVGIGSGAAGTVYREDGTGFRWNNICDIKKYTEFWTKYFTNVEFNIENQKIQTTEEITGKVSKYEFFMMGLRTCYGINSQNYEKNFGEKLPKTFINLIEKWNKNCLAVINKTENGINYSLNEKGLLFLNKFLQELEIE